eukprot:TRINITY_DN16816_c0_g1_i1.p1 TRINITY_DN16816_c0_g1~~TRINITY_DN16816_c0_g1_i1.p1  ORF type:complete len:162 (-),score=21.84 TRINITY_DN16816_c0_g1_i1:211-696(-)
MPIIAPGISHIKQHMDPIHGVNIRVYVDVLGGEVIAETVQSVHEGVDLFQPYLPPTISGNELFLPTGTSEDDSSSGNALTPPATPSCCYNHRRPAKRSGAYTTTIPVSPKMRLVPTSTNTTTTPSSTSPTTLPLDDDDVSSQDATISPILNLVSRYGRLNM